MSNLTLSKQNTLLSEIKKQDVTEETAMSLKETFVPFFDKAQEWKEKSEAIQVTSIEQKEEMLQAREARLALRSIRVEADKKRKELKEDSLRKGRAIDGIFNIIKYLIEPIEKHLEDQEKFAERMEEKRKEELRDARLSELAGYGFDGDLYPLGIMDEEAYNQILETAKISYERKMEKERKEEEERQEQARKAELKRQRENEIAPYRYFAPGSLLRDLSELSSEEFDQLMNAVKEDKAKHDTEQERIREENDRLKKEAEEREAREKSERERLAKIEADRKAKEDADRRAQEEKERKAREAHEAALKAEREEKARIAAELKAKQDQEEVDRKVREEAERAARMAPDKDKLLSFAKSIENIAVPDLDSEEGNRILTGARAELVKTANRIRISINKLNENN